MHFAARQTEREWISQGRRRSHGFSWSGPRAIGLWLLDACLLPCPGAACADAFDDRGRSWRTRCRDGPPTIALRRLSRTPPAINARSACGCYPRRRNGRVCCARERRSETSRSQPLRTADRPIRCRAQHLGTAWQQFFNPRELVAVQSTTILEKLSQ